MLRRVQSNLPERGGIKKDVETPLVEKRCVSTEDLPRWKQYNRHRFSPYANTAKGWSISLFTVKGSPFCREENGTQRTLVPAYIHGAIGGNGEFTVEHENGPVQLSGHDYNKWEHETGDVVVMIGGHSSSSTILTLTDSVNREILANVLTDDKNRRMALDLLNEWGFDTGAAGENPGREIEIESSGSTYTTSLSPAAKLQRQAENGDISDLIEEDQLRIGNRLLEISDREGAHEWFAEQYGDDYDKKMVAKKLDCIVAKYGDFDLSN